MEKISVTFEVRDLTLEELHDKENSNRFLTDCDFCELKGVDMDAEKGICKFCPPKNKVFKSVSVEQIKD